VFAPHDTNHDKKSGASRSVDSAGMTPKLPLRARALGERIREAYEGQGLSRAAFQRLLQRDPALATLNYKTIVDWEQGAVPRLKVLRAIAAVLGRTVEELSAEPAATCPTCGQPLTPARPAGDA